VVREKGVDNLWVQPLDRSARRQLTHFISERISGYAFSKDGTRLGVGYLIASPAPGFGVAGTLALARAK
jgi:hypothetical protein